MQRIILSVVAVLALLGSTVQAQVPQIINYQGRVQVGTTNFDGTGQFKFALVNQNGSVTYWSNDGTSTAGSQPTNAVSLSVAKGLYSVLLGDTSVAGMTGAIPPSVFSNPDVRLRVWFNNGTNGSQLLTPDQRIASTGYAMMAGNVPNGAITSEKIAGGAVTSSQIDTTSVQQRITGSAPSGSFITGINPDGSVITETSSSGIWSVNNIGYPYFGSGGFGSVGIGTDSPAAALHIANTGGNTLRLDGASPRINFIDTGNSNTLTGIGAQAGSFYVSNNQTGNLMQLTAAGRMGLGTSTPLSALHVSGNADALRLTGPQPYLTLENTTANFISRIQANGAGMDFKTNGAAINNHPGIIHLDGTGIVGFGTTLPKHHLSIKYFDGGPIWTSNGWIGAIDLDNSAAIAWGANSAGQRFGMGHTNGSFSMWRTAADPGTRASPAIYDFVINDAGNVGIGATNPPLKLTVQTPPNSYGIEHTDGAVRIGTYAASSSGGWLGTFTNHKLNFFTNNGSPGLTVDTNGSVGVGTTAPASKLDVNGDVSGTRLILRADPAAPTNAAILCANPNVTNFVPFNTANNRAMSIIVHDASVRQLTIRGGADLAEPFPMAEQGVPPGAVVSIDAKNPGKLRMSRGAYDKRAAGIVSGANGIKPGISMIDEEQLEAGENVALSGRVYVQANTSAGAIEPGDLLTTSDLPGEAMKAVDHQRAQGSVLGKAMTPLTEGTGMVLVLVTLQ